MGEISKLWHRLEAWLRRNQPELDFELNPPATDEQLNEVEATIGAKLPAEVREFYKVHNGQNPDAIGILYGSNFMSLEQAVDDWRVWKELLDAGTFNGMQGAPARGIRNDWWNPLWFPFVTDYNSNPACVDLDPAPSGAYGQIIQMDHETPDRGVPIASIVLWFDTYVSDVEAGTYAYDEDFGRFMDVT